MVIAIIGILAAIAVPTAGHFIGLAKESADKATQDRLLSALLTTEEQIYGGTFEETPYGQKHLNDNGPEDENMRQPEYSRYMVKLDELLELNFSLPIDTLTTLVEKNGGYAYWYTEKKEVIRIDGLTYPDIPTTGGGDIFYANIKLMPGQSIYYYYDGVVHAKQQN